MGKFISVPLPRDLPENWNDSQYVSPNGVETGLSTQHGYNYLMKQVNNAQKAVSELDDALSSHENLLHNWYWGDANSIIDQRQGYVVPKGTTYYADATLTNVLGQVIEDYIPAHIVNSSYGYVVTGDASTVYVKRSDMVRGYATQWAYTVDRWFNPSLPVLINSNSISFRSIDQFTEEVLSNGPYTASVLLADGSFYTGSATYTAGLNAVVLGGNGVIDVYLLGDVLHNGRTRVRIQTADSSYRSVVAVKLERSEQQTLAYQDEEGHWILNGVPDKKQELLKCCMSEADPDDTYTHNTKTAGNVGAEIKGLVQDAGVAATNEGITSIVQKWIASMPDLQVRNFVLRIDVLNLVLDGGTWFVTVNRASETYATVIATRYDVSGIYVKGCSLNEGVLTDWITLVPDPVVPATIEEEE